MTSPWVAVRLARAGALTPVQAEVAAVSLATVGGVYAYVGAAVRAGSLHPDRAVCDTHCPQHGKPDEETPMPATMQPVPTAVIAADVQPGARLLLGGVREVEVTGVTRQGGHVVVTVVPVAGPGRVPWSFAVSPTTILTFA